MYALISRELILLTVSAWSIVKAKHRSGSPVCFSGGNAVQQIENGGALLQSSLISSSVPTEESLSPESALIPGYDPTTPEGGGYYYQSGGSETKSHKPANELSTDEGAADGYYHHGAGSGAGSSSRAAPADEAATANQVVQGEVGSDAQLKFDSSAKLPGAGTLPPDVLAAADHTSAALTGMEGLPPDILAATSHAKATLSGDAILAATNHAKAALRGDDSLAATNDAEATTNDAKAALSGDQSLFANDVGGTTGSRNGGANNAGSDMHVAKGLPSSSKISSVPIAANRVAKTVDLRGAAVALQPTTPSTSKNAMLQGQGFAPQIGGNEPRSGQPIRSALQAPLLPMQPAQSPQLQAQLAQQALQQPQAWQPQQQPSQQIWQQPGQWQLQASNSVGSTAATSLVGPPLTASNEPRGGSAVAPQVPQKLLYTPIQQGIVYSSPPIVVPASASKYAAPQMLVAQPDVAVSPSLSQPAPEATSIGAKNTTANVSSSSLSNSSNTSSTVQEISTTPFPENDNLCRTREDERAVVWYMETAPGGSPCVFGVDPRDEGRHCIYDNGKYGSDGWCYTDKDRYAWGSCNGNCPLFGLHAQLGEKIDAVNEQVQEVNKQMDELFAPTTTTTTFSTIPLTPAPNVSNVSNAPEVTTPPPESLEVGATSAPTIPPATLPQPTAAPTTEPTVEATTAPPTAPAPPPAPAIPKGPLAPAAAPVSTQSKAPLAAAPGMPLAAAPGLPPGMGPNPNPKLSAELASAPGPFPGYSSMITQRQTTPNAARTPPMPLAAQGPGVDASDTAWTSILSAAQRHDAGALRQLLGVTGT